MTHTLESPAIELTDTLPPNGYLVSPDGYRFGCVSHQAEPGLDLELLAFFETEDDAQEWLTIYGFCWSVVRSTLDDAMNMARSKESIHGVGLVKGNRTIAFRCVR